MSISDVDRKIGNNIPIISGNYRPINSLTSCKCSNCGIGIVYYTHPGKFVQVYECDKYHQQYV